ncbi:carboxymuconolactone decarboxylase family protein [Thalassobaculum sp. OXR-137]|uniref:carboxymuconolactone decarboxylase family protein n=1 Tax=Thalassobaculum sp. OXR-137 TaxID=3100173 RepID=UPI002AC965D6|nr:carboxymuconolactone decarboxylase family protein [Thalassobaculum sp. OXR-137]WPZ33471.1 carboxymuconolactone decarboxylase family protein [Thalassobaculum sp. OXR-137]
MTPRLANPYPLAKDGFAAMVALEKAIAASPIEKSLLHLIKLRASQINGCAYCIHMHTTEARRDGESEMRLYMTSAWRESSLYSDRERAALAWTEALTRVAETGVPDADWELVRDQFEEAERAWLSLTIGAINVWNRVAVGFRYNHPVESGAGHENAA